MDQLDVQSERKAMEVPQTTRLTDIERLHIERVLGSTAWSIEGGRGAASVLGLKPSTLRSRMRKLGIRRPAEADMKPAMAQGS